MQAKKGFGTLFTGVFLAEFAAAVLVILYAAFVADPSAYAFTPKPTGQFFGSGVGTIFLLAFLTLVSVMLLAASAMMWKRVGKMGRNTFCLALFFLFAAVWILFISGLAEMENTLLMKQFTFFSFYLMPIPFLMYVRGVCSRGRIPIGVLILLFEASFVVNFIWLLLRALVFPPTLIVVHILLILSVIVCVVISLIEHFWYHNKQVREMLVGVLCLAVFVPIDLLTFYANPEAGFFSYTGVGIILFAIALSMGAIRALTSATVTYDKLEQLRIREEEFRIAAEQSDKTILRYDVKGRVLSLRQVRARYPGVPELMPDMPQSLCDAGMIAPESRDTLFAFFDAMHRGESAGVATLRMRNIHTSEYRWYHCVFTTIFDNAGVPQDSIISFYDATEQREMETIYEKWKQEIASLPEDRMALCEWNLTRDVPEAESGGLMRRFEPIMDACFNERTLCYAQNDIHPADRQAYIALVNREHLIAAYRQGITAHELDYRVTPPGDEPCWRRLTIQVVRYPDSGEIKAYLIIRDIDDEKREQIAMQTRAREDALTGALNRGAFAEEVNALLREGGEGARHAFVMLDIDGFKQVNDTFGHAQGDKLLISITANLKALLREGDLIGRVGGDEFSLCLRNIPYDSVIDKRAQMICRLLHTRLSERVTVSGSVGVAIYPRDGKTFEDLYRNADIAMYYAKAQGRNRYVFFNPENHTEGGQSSGTPIDAIEGVALPPLDGRAMEAIIGQNEMLLRQQREDERYRLVMEGYGIALFEWDYDTLSYYASPGMDAYALRVPTPIDLSAEDVFAQGVHPDDRGEIDLRLIAPLREGASRAEVNIRLLLAEGGYDWSRLGLVLVRHADGAPSRILGTIQRMQYPPEEARHGEDLQFPPNDVQ